MLLKCENCGHEVEKTEECSFRCICAKCGGAMFVFLKEPGQHTCECDKALQYVGGKTYMPRRYSTWRFGKDGIE